MDNEPLAHRKSQKWQVGAICTFVMPFLVVGYLAEQWSLERGAEDAERWSHLLKPTPVPMAEKFVPLILWFVVPGFVAGIVGLLLYYLFTRCRSY
ncbi:MAG: hypothetical protein K2Z81_02615 [Cyanobacteria bacterium]|nr:hypothetical protein [Cyanobacteriota bacterium]